jgi:toxin FitB
VILLDTNVLSALMRPTRVEPVVAWLNAQIAEDVWTTTISVFEIRVGIQLLPISPRRRALEDAFRSVVEGDLEGRIAGFDLQAAEATAALAARRRLAGRMVEIRDTQIAGIALAHVATIATRNVRDFDDLTTPVVNPWA